MFKHADEMISVFKVAYRNNVDNINYALQVLKDYSWSQVTTIIILKKELDVSLNEAHAIFTKSKVWD